MNTYFSLAHSHHYFKYCKISALALLKMVMHARSGGNLEVMGLMLGKVDGETMIIMDSFALPVEGTETRVNAQAAAYEYMAAYIENAKQVRCSRKLTGFMKERRRTKVCRNTARSIGCIYPEGLYQNNSNHGIGYSNDKTRMQKIILFVSVY